MRATLQVLIAGMVSLVMAPVTVSCADDSGEWLSVSPEMDETEYREAWQHNRKYLKGYVTSWSKNTLRSAGVPKSGIKFMGGAAGFAVTHDATFYLGDRKLFAIELQDVTEEDPKLLFGIKTEW